MINFKKLFYSITGNVYIPPEILHTHEEILLHISDTPVNFFSPLKRILHQLKPDYIVHTGDLVDNIKLEIYPYRLEEYKKNVKSLIQIVESSSAKEIYLTIGNHDHKETVQQFIKKSFIIEKRQTITIQDHSMDIGHFPNKTSPSSIKYHLFGHDLTLHTQINDKKIYLNGLSTINIIFLNSGKIFTLPYPYGTNDSRMCKSKIGF
ncbi:metallophosphoesterase [Inediibacterium massiliense]|uniref:metallophosphoesterase n=1 Tax=Inediibacterium massiliense TaxID=1658111 RepID=UPI0006B5B077|nr:metallophosphoesterase [Inediibacterium massiliense]